MAISKEDIKRVVEDLERKTVCLYRVSTDKQGTEDDTPTQRNECREYAKNMGFEIVEELVTKISGFKVPLEEREDLNKVKELVRDGKVNTVLVYHSDRLARQTEAVALLDNLSKLGIQVYSTKEGLLNGKEHIDGLLSFIRFWQSSGESKKTSFRVKDAIKTLNEQGYYTSGVLPFGYMLEDTKEKRNAKSNKTIQKIVQNPQESKIVKLIFNLALTKGYGATKITKYLNEHGYKTRSGKAWRHNRISSMLRNTVYMGFKRYNTLEEDVTKEHKHLYKKPNEMNVQPYNKDLDIVGEDIFNQVQHFKKSNNFCQQ